MKYVTQSAMRKKEQHKQSLAEIKMAHLFCKHLYKFLTHTGVLLIATIPLQAQPLLTLEEVVQTVLKKNIAIKSARNEQKIVAQKYHIGNAGFLPTLDATLTSGAKHQTWPQALDSPTTLSTGLSLTCNVFSGMQSILTYRHLGKLSQIGQLKTQQTTTAKVAEAIKGYYSLVLAQQKKHILQSSLVISKEILQLAKAKYEVGQCSKLDYLDAQVQHHEAQAKLLAQEEALTVAKLALHSLLGKDGPEEFAIVEAIPLPQKLTWEGLVEAATVANTAILTAQKHCEDAAIAIRLQQAKLWPRVDFSLGYTLGSRYQEQAWNATPRSWNYGINITFNLFHAFQHTTAIQEAHIKADNAQLALAAQHVQLEAALKQQFLHYTQQLQRHALVQQHVQVSQERATVALEQYRLGSITLLALDKVRQNTQETKLKSLQAIYEAKVAETALQQLTGTLLDSYK